LEDLTESLRAARRRLLTLVEGLTQDEALRRPSRDEWSIIEILAHLIEVDRFYLSQALAMRDGPDHLLSYFDDEAWKRQHSGIGTTPLAEVIAGMQRSHTEVLQAVTAMSEEELSRPGRHPRGIPYTVRDVMLRLPAHDENHEQQILSLLDSRRP
jgi:uncharacterized damage-inducible protein DinB